MSGPVMTEEQLANLSDEELMQMAIPPEAAAPPAPEEEETNQDEGEVADAGTDQNDGDAGSTPDSDDGQDDPAGSADDSDTDDGAGDDEALGQDDDKFAENTGTEKQVDTKAGEGDKPEKGEKPDSGDKPQSTSDGVKSDSQEPDYKAFYEKIMGPFKANGKEIKLQNPEEAVTLMQMGANYTKKLQALQPNLKLLKMLENNALLDPGKLSFLIDLSKKDPAAIQKFIRESGVDPMDIDTSQEPTYQAKDYQVSDAEMAFTTTLEEVTSDPVGKEMVIHINKTWDAPSKEALWGDPQILRVVTEQKQNGIYDQIASEVERRQILGQLRNVPFLQAYKEVGQEMHAQGRLVPQTPATGQQQETTTPAPQPSRVVDTRPAKKPAAPSNHDRARAASPTKTVPKSKTPSDFNPLSMSDEDFEKTQGLANRL